MATKPLTATALASTLSKKKARWHAAETEVSKLDAASQARMLGAVPSEESAAFMSAMAAAPMLAAAPAYVAAVDWHNKDGRLEAFARGTDNALWHCWQMTPGGNWSGWASRGGVSTSVPSVVSNADGRLEVFARGSNGALWHIWQTTPNGSWSGWASMGDGIVGDQAVASNKDGRLQVLVRGTDLGLWQRWQTAVNNGWN